MLTVVLLPRPGINGRLTAWHALQGGCIIRAVFLDDIYQAYKRNPNLENLMMDKEFATKLVNSEKAWRSVVTKVCCHLA